MKSTYHMSFYLGPQSCARTCVRTAETVMATLRKEAEELRMGKRKANKQKGGAQLAQSVMELASTSPDRCLHTCRGSSLDFSMLANPCWHVSSKVP
eukprot:4420955-Amphidinium_carterae.2